MKAIILAAGKGKRLGPVTEKLPKPMIEIEGEPILLHNVLWLKNEGIVDFHINLHYLPDVIKNYFGDGRRWGVKITYYYEPKILGTAGAVKNIAESWDEDFLVVYGDNFYKSGFGLSDFLNLHLAKKAVATIGVYRAGGDLKNKGVVVLDKEALVLAFFEKIEQPPSALINAGLYILSPAVVKKIPGGFSDFGKDIFPSLIKKDIPIFGYLFHKGSIIAIDTPALLEQTINSK